MLLLLALSPARAACPPVDWPPGLDLGPDPVEVRATVTGTDAAGWSGPDPLVDAVRATLGACELAPGPHALVWRFDPPPVNVAGQVRLRGDGAPVATVVAVGDRTARTDADGRFALRNVAPGPATVRIVDPAWRLPDTVALTVAPGQRSELALWVVPDQAPLNGIVAWYAPEGDVGVVRTVDVERARAVPATLGDPLRALAAEPGLARSPYDAGWLLVRGGDFDETGLYLDGVRVPLVYHLGGFTSVLHPEMIEAVRFWPGPFPARYGDALSGAVDLVPRDVGDRTRAVGGANLVFADAYVEAPTRFGGVALAMRRSYLDGVLAAVVGREGAKIAPRFWDVSGQLRIGRARILALGLRDAVDTPSLTGSDVITVVQQGAQVQAVLPLTREASPVRATLRPWFAWTGRSLEGIDTPREAVDELYPGLRLEADAPLGEGHGSAGLEVERQWFRLDKAGLVRTAPVWRAEPYAGLGMGRAVHAWSEVRLSTLAAVGDVPRPVRTGWSPRAGVDWAPADGVALHAAFGRFHQPPPATLSLPVAEGAYLPLERSDELTAGFALTRAAWALDADAWVRRSADLAEIELDGSIGPSEARAHGLESRLRTALGPLEASLLYQYTRTFRREDPGDAWGPGPFDAPHRAELLLVDRLPRAWTASARLRATSGYARVEEWSELFPTEAFDVLRQQHVELGLGPEDPRLAPFWAVDLRVARTFAFRRWQLDLALDVQNATNRRVVEPVITGFGDSRPPYGFGLPVLPILSAEGRFYP
ncbi:MAG: TonB-dependent receptor [Myxococcota bacterium]